VRKCEAARTLEGRFIGKQSVWRISLVMSQDQAWFGAFSQQFGLLQDGAAKLYAAFADF
jgi:hypothetical protein